MEILGYVASLGIGLALGLMGGGGSMLSIPVLVYLFSVQAMEATAYSIVIVGVTSFVGALHRVKFTAIDLHTGFVFGLPAIFAFFITRKWCIPYVPDILWQSDAFTLSKRFLILLIFALLIMLSSYVMITKNITPSTTLRRERRGWLLFQGLVVGFVTGFVGIGGGFIILPSLVFFSKLPFKTAVGTTLFIIAMKSLFGFLADISHFTFQWVLLSKILVLAIAGILIGNIFSERVSGKKLKKSFGWFTLALGVIILFAEILQSIGTSASS